MEKRRFSFVIFLLLFSLPHIQAQWENPPGHYWTVRGYYNPSFAGETDAIRTSALYRYQWKGVENAPRQIFLMADMPFEFLGIRHGAGFVSHTETVGKLRNSLLAAQYSFKKEIGKGFLNIGLQAGIYDLDFDAGSKRIAGDTLTNIRGTLKVNQTDKQVVDLNVGISWTGKNVFAGFSAMHITQPRFFAQNDSLLTDQQSDSGRAAIPRYYNLSVGYNISLFHSLEIQPMIWVQTDFGDAQAVATLRLEYNKMFSGGASWKMDDGYLFFAGTVIRGVTVGYAYGLHTAGPGQNSKGSHEFCLRYNFPLDYFKPKRQPHKSIRLL